MHAPGGAADPGVLAHRLLGVDAGDAGRPCQRLRVPARGGAVHATAAAEAMALSKRVSKNRNAN